MSTGFEATSDFFEAMDNLLEHPECPEYTYELISGIVNNCHQTGYVTEKQARTAGGAYKAVVNGGRFIKHDWWH